ncbi:hypothetical protein QZH41_012737 [Actinostola sp. cb2023]|nr:hypothetical protein QZH41_012737 [Actinostola sp. cb2023]
MFFRDPGNKDGVVSCTKSLHQPRICDPQDQEDHIKSNVLKDYFKRLVLCDGRGHLTDHLMAYPSHNKLYSFKLRRLIKCCKSTCSVVDASKLLMCSTCLNKQFNSHYNMINATW